MGTVRPSPRVCRRHSVSGRVLAASSRPRSRAGCAQSRTVLWWPSQVAAVAQVAAPVPPPMSTWVAGDQSGTRAANAVSAARTASKVAGIR